jgi:hypothetical protein
VITQAASGERELPALTLEEGSFEGIILAVLRWLGSWIVVLIPALVCMTVMFYLGIIRILVNSYRLPIFLSWDKEDHDETGITCGRFVNRGGVDQESETRTGRTATGTDPGDSLSALGPHGSGSGERVGHERAPTPDMGTSL